MPRERTPRDQLSFDIIVGTLAEKQALLEKKGGIEEHGLKWLGASTIILNAGNKRER